MRPALLRVSFSASDLRSRWISVRPLSQRAWLTARRVLGSRQWLVAVLVFVPVLLAALLGYAIALGSTLLTLMAAAIIVGPLVLFVPSRALVVLLFGLTFMGSGLAMYYGKINQSHWLPYVLCLWLWIKLPMDALARREGQHVAVHVAPPLVALYVLFAAALLTTALNTSPILSFIVGAKNYLFIWSAAFVIAAGVFDEADLRRMWLALLLVGGLQAPFAVHQHFSQFSGGGSWDSVVGSFGGDPEGGGASGAMVIYLSIVLGLAVALWRRAQLSGLAASMALLGILLAVGMAEVKAFFVFAPLMLGVVLVREMRARPAVGFAIAIACVVAVGGMFAYYKHAYFDDSRNIAQSDNASDYFEYILSADSKLDLINRRTGEVSRLGAPLLWDREVQRFGVDRRWLGFGLRAARMGTLIGAGEAARHFPYSLTTSAVTVLLWDVGLLGLVAMLGLLAATGWTAWRLSRQENVPVFHQGALEACSGGSLVLLASAMYNDSLIDHYTIQVLLAVMVGYVVYWHRSSTSPARASRDRA